MSQTVLVTGAGSAIDLASALVFAAKRFHIHASVLDLDQWPNVEQAADYLGLPPIDMK